MQAEIPNHVAIILDGNRRWAKKHGLTSLIGHKKGAENMRTMAKYIFKQGIKYLSVFAFSTENFKRTEEEVGYLMNLFLNEFTKEYKKIHEENIKIVFSGRKYPLREDILKVMDEITELTKNNTGGVFNICLNYGGHTEIIDATKRITNDVINNNLNLDDLTEDKFSKYLYHNLPPIDLLIRTSGEYRLSNFMLWQLSYAELYFTEVEWPAFDDKEFAKALASYQKRERRFGGNKNETKSN